MLSYTSDQNRYTSEVQQWHHDVGPHIPIGDFVNYLDPEALGLENAAQFYAPVEFSIHVKGHISEPAGAIRLHVPVHANENWLSILKEHIGSMYNVGAQYIDLRDVAGRSVTVFDKDQLENVGKLNVYVDGRKTRLDTMPEVPAEYSINKLNSIESWFNAVKADLPEIAAKELVKCNSVDELIEAIAPGGSVESVIKSELHERTSNWNEFVRVNRMNSPYSLSSEGAEQALDAIGETIRGELDAFVRSAPQQISSYFSSIQAERMQRKLYQEGRDVEGYKQLFNAMPAHIKVTSENGFQMFHDFASNVFDSPMVAEDITNVIYVKPIAGCRWETDPETKNFYDGRNQNNQKETREEKKVLQKEKNVPVPKNNNVPKPAPVPVPTTNVPKPAPAPAPANNTPKSVPVPVPTTNVPKTDTAPANNDEIDDEIAGFENKTNLTTYVNKNYENFVKNNMITLMNRMNDDDLGYFGVKKDAVDKFMGFVGLVIEKKTTKEGAVSSKDLLDVKQKTVAIRNALNIVEPMKARIEAHHPWNAHIQKLKDISGSYPDHYIENHNKMDLSEHAPYEGDAEETYEAYHMFAGAAVMPKAEFINRHRCMDKHKKKKKKKHSRERPPLVNASVAMQMRERPLLVPINAPIQEEELRERPLLVPINAPIQEEELRERPPLVPINAPIRERPALVSASVAMQMRERNVKVEKIGSPSRFAGLPSVDDLF